MEQILIFMFIFQLSIIWTQFIIWRMILKAHLKIIDEFEKKIFNLERNMIINHRDLMRK